MSIRRPVNTSPQLLFLFLVGEIVKETVKDRQDKAEQQCPPETIYVESHDQIVGKQDDDGIDDQQK